MAEFVPLLPSRRLPYQSTPEKDAETFTADVATPALGPAPAPIQLGLALGLLGYAILSIILVATAQASVPGWLYQSILSLGLVAIIAVALLFVFRVI